MRKQTYLYGLGMTQRVSVDSCGNQANDHSDFSGKQSISSDGRYVAFASNATNLVLGDTNSRQDVFVHDRQGTQPKDCIAPTTIASAFTSSGPYESGTWTNEDVEVTFSAQDNEGGSGVQNIRYSVITGFQGFPETVYVEQNPPVIKAEGTTTIRYFATDKAGNRESPAKTFTVKIDKTPPTANVSINAGDTFTNNTAVNLTLTSSDPSPGTGVAQMRFSNDGASWSQWEPFATSNEWMLSEGDGEKTVHVQFKDAADNESDTAQDAIVLDKTAPVISSSSPSNNATGVAATANISATFFEEGSGIDPDTLTADTFSVVQVKPTGNVRVSGTVSYDEASQTATFTPSNSLAKGLYRATITARVQDKAGNELTSDYTWTFATAGPSKR